MSQGYFSPNKPAGTVGIANIYVNGKDYSKKKRGYNVVVVDETTGMYDSFPLSRQNCLMRGLPLVMRHVSHGTLLRLLFRDLSLKDRNFNYGF